MFEDANRAIGFSLLISLALHAALLFALPMLREAQHRRSDVRDPILARLMQPPVRPAASPVLPQSLPESTKPPAAPAAPRPQSKTRPASEPAPAEQPQPASVEPVLAMREPTEASPGPPATPAVSIPPAQAETSSSRPAPPTPDVADAGTLAQYRLAVIAAAKRYKRYPRVALDNNWQGRVEIRMTIGTNGAISGLSVRTSTGYPVLDQQALEMIERAKAIAQIPPVLRGREWIVDIPVIFSLREPDA